MAILSRDQLPITIDPEIHSGTPVFRGTRVPVQTLYDYLADGYTLDEILDNFPSVNREDALLVMLMCASFKDFPKPYKGQKTIKAIVLGADPSTPNQKPLVNVFDIGGDKRYFSNPLINLAQLSLSLDNLYVQNVVRNYCLSVTDENKHWQILAQIWLPELKRELDQLDPTQTVPVFITARKIYFALTGHPETPALNFGDYYRNPRFIPANENLLHRKIFPLSRHYKYKLENWKEYREYVYAQIYSDSIV